MNFATEILSSNHEKAHFSSGKHLLDNYFQKQASQDVKRKLAVCFVLPDEFSKVVKGFYTLSNSNISVHLVPFEFRKKLPPAYTYIPTALIGRLAVDLKFQGQGLGKLILVDALKRAYILSLQMGSFAVVVDPIDHEAELFYQKYGFIKLPESGKMFLPMSIIEQCFEFCLP